MSKFYFGQLSSLVKLCLSSVDACHLFVLLDFCCAIQVWEKLIVLVFLLSNPHLSSIYGSSIAQVSQQSF